MAPHWPFILNIENLAQVGLENTLFLDSRYVAPQISMGHLSPLFSDISGVFTLIGELCFISILFLPRFRLFFVGTMIMLHLLVFLMAGINFVGSSFVLLLCLDYNNTLIKLTFIYVPPKLKKYWAKLKSLDWFNNLEPSNELSETSQNQKKYTLQVKDESGQLYLGLDAITQIALKIPLLILLGIILQILGMMFFPIKITQYFFRKLYLKIY